MDRVTLKSMEFYSHSGIHSFEKDVGQLFEIDLECFLDLSLASRSDHLSDTINYAELFQTVKDVMEKSSFNLMERLAGEIAGKVFERFPVVERLTVRCRKPRVPVKGFIAYAEVEIKRERES
ncbi:MAG: dihydroneopterin aldolase [Gemmatimonadota bacterium]|nr:dihydroneopterin aldolase [Gemmatimonadota bacterium]